MSLSEEHEKLVSDLDKRRKRVEDELGEKRIPKSYPYKGQGRWE